MTDSQLKKLENKKSATHFYIKKGSYYRPNMCGYTDDRRMAGIYKKEEAILHARQCREVDLIQVDIAEHNSEIVKESQSLLSRFLYED